MTIYSPVLTALFQAGFLAMCIAIPSVSSCAEGSENADFGANVRMRGSLENARIRFERTGKGHVAFIGGSITEMNGYRPLVCDLLKRRFPGTHFEFTNAGISSTCSTTGAFRLDADVLSKGDVDLFFVEFAVNDDQDAHHSRTECIRGMEGILRHALQRNPYMNIVVTYFVNEGMLKSIDAGQTPLTIEAHEAVAAHYGISTINLAREVAEEIRAGTLTWERYGGVHPAPAGNAICAKMIDALFDRAQAARRSSTSVRQAKLLPPAMDLLNYSTGRFVDPGRARIVRGWSLGVPDWSGLPGSKRERYTSIPMLCATEPGAEASLEFNGTTVGAYIVAGPDAGIVEASVDGGAFSSINLFHSYSKGLHYPRTVLLGADLKPGKHTLTLRVSTKTQSSGHAMRIVQFVVS